MKIALGPNRTRTVYNQCFICYISNNWSIYRNQRPIFKLFFLTPIIRTLKTEEGEIPKIWWGCEIPRDLASGGPNHWGSRPGGQIPGGEGGEIPATPVQAPFWSKINKSNGKKSLKRYCEKRRGCLSGGGRFRNS